MRSFHLDIDMKKMSSKFRFDLAFSTYLEPLFSDRIISCTVGASQIWDLECSLFALVLIWTGCDSKSISSNASHHSTFPVACVNH